MVINDAGIDSVVDIKSTDVNRTDGMVGVIVRTPIVGDVRIVNHTLIQTRIVDTEIQGGAVADSIALLGTVEQEQLGEGHRHRGAELRIGELRALAEKVGERVIEVAARQVQGKMLPTLEKVAVRI